MPTASAGPDLVSFIRSGNLTAVQEALLHLRPQEAADAVAALATADQVAALTLLPHRVASAVFEYLPLDIQKTLSQAMAPKEAAAVLNLVADDDRTRLLSRLPEAETREILSLLTPDEAGEARSLLKYPRGTVGRLMTPHYIAVREDRTVREVLDHVREHGRDSETLNVIYVVDANGVLVDDVRIRELLVVPLDTKMSTLMDRRYVILHTLDTQDDALALFRREDRTALPVVDDNGCLVGIVTVDDVLDVAAETATREMQKFGGSEALDEPYMQVTLAHMIRKRAGWLIVLFLGEMLTATAMGFFEKEIARAVVLALFVPLIISSGGNSGSQGSTLVIRALAVGEVKLRDFWKVIRREVLVGLALGVILGAIGFLRISIWSAFSNLYGPHWLMVALTVAFALIGVVLWGTLVGCGLPFILRRFGFDPATSSAPFVATLVDVTGLIIYFSVGLVVLRGSLL
ncbi:MAG TPA: magnesium transporter [Vicinamibacterales bacterium]|nr:magnesium transporter [Vicinamibacterales bacterium]